MSQQQLNYNRIAEAIEYIQLNFKQQPSLNQIAEKLQLSPFYLQKLFTEWAGISPKKFLQYISIGYAKNLLKEKQVSLFDAAIETGLSGTGRLHDLFINIEGITPGEFKNGGEGLSINYSFENSHFGNLLIASTPIGICYMAFLADETKNITDLKQQFPNAVFNEKSDLLQQNALQFFNQNWIGLKPVKLHLKASIFQLKVWESLLKIPFGHLSSYGNIALNINSPLASRAVGTAIGSNPVAFLIPCHRVIQASGVFGGYRWGSSRKLAIIGWEAAKLAELLINK